MTLMTPCEALRAMVSMGVDKDLIRAVPREQWPALHDRIVDETFHYGGWA